MLAIMLKRALALCYRVYYLSYKIDGPKMMQASKHDSSDDIAFQLLSAAKKAGADDADVLVAEGVSTDVEVRNATLELAERSEGIDLGLRVFLGKKQAIVWGQTDAQRQSQLWQNALSTWRKRHLMILIVDLQSLRTLPRIGI